MKYISETTEIRRLLAKARYFMAHKCDDCDFAQCLCDSEPETCNGPFMPYAGGPGARLNRVAAIEESLVSKAQP